MIGHLVDGVDVIVAVPPGSRRPEPLLAALHAAHPDWNCRPVWAGDPQLRPRLVGAHWLDSGVDEADLLRVDPDGLPWLAALSAMGSVERPTIIIVCGAAVLGDLSSLVPADGEIVVVPKSIEPPINDGTRHPSFEDLGVEGAASATVASFGRGSDDAVVWIRRSLLVPSRLEHAVAVGRVLELAAQLFASRRCLDDRVGASVWRWPTTAPVLLDLPEFDSDRPWLADPTLAGTPRITLGVPQRMGAVNRAAGQLGGTTEPLRLPGGLEVDKTIRRIARHHRKLPAQPWSDAAAFRRWLDERYWEDLHWSRGDLQAVFPYHTGADADRFSAWARRAAADGDAPLMIDPGVLRSSSKVDQVGARRDGVNLVGYFKHQSGVANVGRRVADIFERHGVPHTTVAYERTWSPPIVPPPVTDQRIEFADSLAFVNADQFDHLRNDIPEMFGPGRQVVGYWAWELDTIEGVSPVGHRHADQIWAMTSFMVKPFQHLPVRVEHVHVPLTEPSPSSRKRSEFAPLADADNRFVFGVVLDHLSVTERKNPVAAVRAFRRAFPTAEAVGSGPMLVVKTINAHHAWESHERLLVEASGRDDIVIWDELLPIADHVALIASFDALVSLHRSEGVGLHLAEAMWLERPIIATRYSGNLDFMDADSAVLIDVDMVPVGPGLAPYPPDALWASPRLDDAAAAMRRLAGDVDFARSVGMAARRKMESMPSEAEFVARVTELLRLER